MDILITGGAGYLGSVLVQRLLSAHHHVTVVDNFAHGVPSLSSYCSSRIRIINADASNQEVLLKYAPLADVVIPLAAVVGAPACAKEPERARSLNTDQIRILCDIKEPEQILIFPNTNSGYGTTAPGTVCDEDTPLNPISIYGTTKQESEQRVLQKENSVALRFATLFGPSPRMRLDLLVNEFVYRAVKDRMVVLFESHFRRNFLHVQDAASAILFSIDNISNMCGEAFNVGDSAANLTKMELCVQIKKQVENFSWLECDFMSDPDKRDYTVSNAKIEAFGWEPKVSLEQGIAQLIQCYQQPFYDLRARNI